MSQALRKIFSKVQEHIQRTYYAAFNQIIEIKLYKQNVVRQKCTTWNAHNIATALVSAVLMAKHAE